MPRAAGEEDEEQTPEGDEGVLGVAYQGAITVVHRTEPMTGLLSSHGLCVPVGSFQIHA